MPKLKEMQIKTVIVEGDPNSFKVALSRSILGVTFMKFKRLKTEFFVHRNHNLSVTQNIFNVLYELLLKDLRNLSTWKLKTDFTTNWTDTGKITGASDITIAVYMKVGELKVGKLEVLDEFKNVRVDLFYSETDFASQKLRDILNQTKNELGEESFIYHEYEFSKDASREMAQALNVKGTPTVVINAENKLENPTPKELVEKIDAAFSPMVRPVDVPKFVWDANAFKNAKMLCELHQIEVNK
jgi:hypothetical protein